MSQLVYPIDQAVGFEGQLYDLSIKDTESHAAEGEIFIGKLVSQGSAIGKVVHPALATDITDVKKLKGLAFHHHAIESKVAANYSAPDKSMINVGRKVRAWVKPLTLVTAGTSDVHCYFSGAQQKGSLGGAAVAGETAVVPQAKWKSTTTVIGQLAIIEIDL